MCTFILERDGHIRGVLRDTQTSTDVVDVLPFLQVFGVLLVAFFFFKLLLFFYTVSYDVRRKMGT